MSVKETNSRKRKRNTKYENGLDSTARKRRTLQPQMISRPTIKSEMETTSSRRSSNRQRFVCGVCNINGFNQNGGREMVRACCLSCYQVQVVHLLCIFISFFYNFIVDSSVSRPKATQLFAKCPYMPSEASCMPRLLPSHSIYATPTPWERNHLSRWFTGTDPH